MGTSLAESLGLARGGMTLRSGLDPSLNPHESLHRRRATPQDPPASRFMALAQRMAHVALDRGSVCRMVRHGDKCARSWHAARRRYSRLAFLPLSLVAARIAAWTSDALSLGQRHVRHRAARGVVSLRGVSRVAFAPS